MFVYFVMEVIMKIRRVFFGAVILVFTAVLFGQGFYDIDVINEIEITFSESN